jgi:hypothetical protein
MSQRVRAYILERGVLVGHTSGLGLVIGWRKSWSLFRPVVFKSNAYFAVGQDLSGKLRYFMVIGKMTTLLLARERGSYFAIAWSGVLGYLL